MSAINSSQLEKTKSLIYELFNREKILVTRLSSIGDIVLTTPVIRSLRHKFPTAKIHFVVKYEFASLLESNPNIDKIHALKEDNLAELIDELKLEQFTIFIDLHKNLRTKRIKSALKVKKYFTFSKLNFKKWILVNFKINLLPKGVHLIDRYFEGLSDLNLVNDELGLDYFIPKHEVTGLDDIPLGHQFGYIVCVIGAKHKTKTLTNEKWAELIQKIEYPVILIGGKEDFENGEWIKNKISSGNVYNSCGKFSLNESADLIQKSKFVVGPDTGMVHIAAALKKPIIQIWGNTTLDLGLYPYFGRKSDMNYNAHEVNGLSCRPCSKLGSNTCPKKHFKCMNEQKLDNILENVKKNIILTNRKSN